MRRAAPAFEILMLAPVRRFFPEPRQRLNGSWRRARVCTPPRISPSCPHYVPLWLDRCTIIGWQGHRKTACQSCFRLDGAARHLIGPSLYSRAVQVVFAHPPNRFPSSGLPTDVLLNRIFTFQRTAEVNVPLFNPRENRVLTSHFFKNFLIFFFAHWMDSKAALYPQFSAFAMS